MRRIIPILIFSLLLGALIFFHSRYTNIVKERDRMEYQLSQTKMQVGFLGGQLKQEKELVENMEGERSLLVNNLQEAEGRISQLDLKYTQAREHIFSLTKELQDLEKENSGFLEEKARWEEKSSVLEEQNDRLNRRLHSIPELKKAMKELKIEMRKSRLKLVSTLKPLKRPEITEGNSGFIFRDGMPTHKPEGSGWASDSPSHRTRLKIKVEPAQ